MYEGFDAAHAGGARRATTLVARRLVLGHQASSTRALVRLAVVGAALVVASAAVDGLLLDGVPPPGDPVVLGWLAGRRTPLVVGVARGLTILGHLGVVLAVGTVGVALARRRGGAAELARLIALVVGGSLLVTGGAKELADRPRPDEALVSAVGYAFPSGHAVRAAAVAALVAWLALRLARRRATRIALVLGAVTTAVGIGLSRVVLGIHWPSDVLAGWLLGLAWTVAVIWVLRPVVGRPADDGAHRSGGQVARA